MKTFFGLSPEDTAKELGVNPSTGLSAAEAANRMEKYGSNRLEGGKEKSLIQMILEQLKDFLVIILMIAAVISIFLGEELEGVIIPVSYTHLDVYKRQFPFFRCKMAERRQFKTMLRNQRLHVPDCRIDF